MCHSQLKSRPVVACEQEHREPPAATICAVMMRSGDNMAATTELLGGIFLCWFPLFCWLFVGISFLFLTWASTTSVTYRIVIFQSVSWYVSSAYSYWCYDESFHPYCLLSYDLYQWFDSNSRAPGRFQWHFRLVIFKLILIIDGQGISCEIILRWLFTGPYWW